MNIILPVSSAGLAFDGEPSDAELDAIDRELPLVLAEVDHLDAVISVLDRPVTELDDRRIRRAARRVLDARRALTASVPREAA
ncbi:DUF6284 family protein [Streptomyces sp. JNUCC 64]